MSIDSRGTRGRGRTPYIAGACALAVAVLAGCTPAAPAAPGTQAPGSAEPAALESVLLPVLTEQMEEMGVPGLAVVVDSPDRGVYEVALGLADVETGEPMTLEHHVRIGSVTKTMTATVVLQLAQEGHFGLDDPLSAYFPETETNGASIRQALNMTSGIPTYTTDAFLNALPEHAERAWAPAELLAAASGAPAEFAPGEGWDYSNTNYVLLGLLAERFGEAPLGTLMQERIFDQLAMTECSVPAADDASLPLPFSHGYQYGTRWDEPSPPAALPELVDVTAFNPSWGFGAGEAICTAADMAIWAGALTSGALLDLAMHGERMDFVRTGPLPYGLGIADLNGLIGHHGHMSGFQSQATTRAADGTVIVVLATVTQAPDGELPATKIAELLSRAVPAD